MKLFETLHEFHVFAFRYRATNGNAELEKKKIRVIFDLEYLWKVIRASLGIILRPFYQQKKEIIIFRVFSRFREFRGIDLAFEFLFEFCSRFWISSLKMKILFSLYSNDLLKYKNRVLKTYF